MPEQLQLPNKLRRHGTNTVKQMWIQVNAKEMKHARAQKKKVEKEEIQFYTMKMHFFPLCLIV